MRTKSSWNQNWKTASIPHRVYYTTFVFKYFGFSAYTFRLRERHFKTKRVLINRGTKKSEDSLEGVMFLLGENEKLVQHNNQGSDGSSSSTILTENNNTFMEKEEDCLSYLKVQLPK